MKKYEKIKRVGHDQNKKMFEDEEDELLIKEKLDGANFRFQINEDGEPVFGSKNVVYKIDGEPDYTENVDGRFTDAIEYVREKLEEGETSSLKNKRYTFFAENMVSHSLEYEWENTPQVIGFDVYDHEKAAFLKWSEVKRLFNVLGIPVTPEIERISVEEFKEQHSSEDGYKIPESEYRDGKGEGVVIINTDQKEPDFSGFNYRAKLVTDEFAEKHKKATDANKSKEAVHDHEKVVSKFCTDGRIEKHIHKLRDEGRELGMELMANEGESDGLPIRVAKDIIEEEYDSLATSNWTVDFKKFRSLVADRCVYKLRQEVQKL